MLTHIMIPQNERAVKQGLPAPQPWDHRLLDLDLAFHLEAAAVQCFAGDGGFSAGLRLDDAIWRMASSRFIVIFDDP